MMIRQEGRRFGAEEEEDDYDHDHDYDYDGRDS